MPGSNTVGEKADGGRPPGQALPVTMRSPGEAGGPPPTQSTAAEVTARRSDPILLVQCVSVSPRPGSPSFTAHGRDVLRVPRRPRIVKAPYGPASSSKLTARWVHPRWTHGASSTPGEGRPRASDSELTGPLLRADQPSNSSSPIPATADVSPERRLLQKAHHGGPDPTFVGAPPSPRLRRHFLLDRRVDLCTRLAQEPRSSQPHPCPSPFVVSVQHLARSEDPRQEHFHNPQAVPRLSSSSPRFPQRLPTMWPAARPRVRAKSRPPFQGEPRTCGPGFAGGSLAGLYPQTGVRPLLDSLQACLPCGAGGETVEGACAPSSRP